MKTKTALLLTAALTAATSAQGAIVVTQSDGSYLGSDPFSAAFDVQNANSVLVVGVYLDDNDPAPTGARFGDGGGIGTGDVAADASYNSDRMNMFVFLNPSTASGLKFSINSAASAGGYTAAIWEISGVKLDAGTFTVSTNTTIATDSDNEFIVSIAGVNSNASIIQYNSGSDIESTSVIGGANAPGGGGMRGGTISAATAGSYNVSWTGTGEGQIAIAFEAVPEPGSLALLGLGGLLIGSRRRRA